MEYSPRYLVLALVLGLGLAPARADEVLSWIGVGAIGDKSSSVRYTDFVDQHAEFGQRVVDTTAHQWTRAQAVLGADRGADVGYGGSLQVNADSTALFASAGDCQFGAGAGLAGQLSLHSGDSTAQDGYAGSVRGDLVGVCQLGQDLEFIAMPWMARAGGKTRSRYLNDWRSGLDLEIHRGNDWDVAVSASTTVDATNEADGTEHQLTWEGHAKVLGPLYVGTRGDLRLAVDRERKPTLFGESPSGVSTQTGSLTVVGVAGVAW